MKSVADLREIDAMLEALKIIGELLNVDPKMIEAIEKIQDKLKEPSDKPTKFVR